MLKSVSARAVSCLTPDFTNPHHAKALSLPVYGLAIKNSHDFTNPTITHSTCKFAVKPIIVAHDGIYIDWKRQDSVSGASVGDF